MDEIQAQYVEALDATARAQAAMIERAHVVLRDPKQYGWDASARAAATLPLVGIAAALTELQRALLTGTVESPAERGSTV